MKNKALHLAGRALTLACAAAPLALWAHTGATDHAHGGFADGFVHPFTGLDHLGAMLAVGLWSALAVRPVWLAPVAFVAMLVVGALAGFSGLVVPAVEPMIAASLLVLGLLVATRRGAPLAVAAGIVGVFAFFHGAAHGNELAGDSQWAALAGMALGSAILHGAGMAIGHMVQQRHRWVSTTAGAAVALLGAALLTRMAMA